MSFNDPTEEQLAAFAVLRTAGPVHMLNMVRFRERAAYPDGRDATGAEAYRLYMREAAPAFQRVGARQGWHGAFVQTLIGPADERWDVVFVAEYPSADAFLAMLEDPSYRAALPHRRAAVLDSRLIRLSPT
ncbi:MAG: DUF1330 domain-containing protein [Polyangiales bacterium]